jgi:hypothetical protein
VTDNHEKPERPVTTGLRSLQHHPTVVWILAFSTIIGPLLTLWIFGETKPTRAISYDWRSESIVSAKDAAMLGAAFDLDDLGNSDIYLNHLRVWNSGNLDILDEHFYLPLKISYPSDVFMVEVRHFNVPLENLVGDVQHSFQFNKLFPGGGLLIIFVSLGTNDAPVVEGQIYGVGSTRPPDNRSPNTVFGFFFPYVGLTVFMLLFAWFWLRSKYTSILERLGSSGFRAFFTAWGLVFAWIIVRGLFLAPPF